MMNQMNTFPNQFNGMSNSGQFGQTDQIRNFPNKKGNFQNNSNQNGHNFVDKKTNYQNNFKNKNKPEGRQNEGETKFINGPLGNNFNQNFQTGQNNQFNNYNNFNNQNQNRNNFINHSQLQMGGLKMGAMNYGQGGPMWNRNFMQYGINNINPNTNTNTNTNNNSNSNNSTPENNFKNMYMQNLSQNKIDLQMNNLELARTTSSNSNNNAEEMERENMVVTPRTKLFMKNIISNKALNKPGVMFPQHLVGNRGANESEESKLSFLI